MNLSKPLTLTLTDIGGGIYEYSNGAFFPVDGDLYGNQSAVHHYGFTFELHTKFTYALGQTFAFTGDDDVWVFIDKKLAIDLGGVHGAASASVADSIRSASLPVTTTTWTSSSPSGTLQRPA